MKPLSIGVDWDDVIMPWFDPAIEVCKKAGICPPDAVVTSWSQYEQMGCTFEEWLAALAEATEDGSLYDTVPFPGAIEAIRKLYFEGHYIHIVTARGTWANNPHNERIHEITRQQVEEFAMPHHSLTFTRDKTAVPCDFFIDDNIKNFRALRAAGVHAYLLTRPWNVDEDVEWAQRVESVEEFAEIVIEWNLMDIAEGVA